MDRDQPQPDVDPRCQREGQGIDAPDAHDVDHESVEGRQDLASRAQGGVDEAAEAVVIVFLVLVQHVGGQLCPGQQQGEREAAGRVAAAVGWPGATIAAIAQEAGVAKETVYAVFGTKAALIGAMVRARVGEGAEGQPVLDDPRARAIAAEADPVRRITLWSGYLGDVLSRVAPLMAVVRSGAEVEPEMAELYRTLHLGRRANLARVAQSICADAPLRPGVTIDSFTEVLWQLAIPEMFGLLTGVGGMTAQGHAAWLAGMLTAALLAGQRGLSPGRRPSRREPWRRAPGSPRPRHPARPARSARR